MYECHICGLRHQESPDICKEKKVQQTLSETFDQIFRQYGVTPALRLMIAEYTVGYMGAKFGLHVSG